MFQTISFHAARASTGRTTIIANVAAMLALRGKRVGIIDADLFMPGQHILFGLEQDSLSPTLNDYLWGDARLEQCVYPVTARLAREVTAETAIPGAICLVPAGNDVDRLSRVWRDGYDLDLLHEAIPALAHQEKLDYVLLDTHPGFQPEALLNAVYGDLLLIVSSPDAQHLSATHHLMDAIRRIKEPPMWLILNMVLPGFPPDPDAVAAYHLDTAATLPASERLARLYSRGFFSLREPTHDWSLGIAGIADLIMKGQS